MNNVTFFERYTDDVSAHTRSDIHEVDGRCSSCEFVRILDLLFNWFTDRNLRWRWCLSRRLSITTGQIEARCRDEGIATKDLKSTIPCHGLLKCVSEFKTNPAASN